MDYDLGYKIKLVNNYLYSDKSIEEFLVEHNLKQDSFKKWLFEKDIFESEYNSINFLKVKMQVANIRSAIIFLMLLGLLSLIVSPLIIFNIINWDITYVFVTLFVLMLCFCLVPIVVVIYRNNRIIVYTNKGIIFNKTIFGKIFIRKVEDIKNAKVHFNWKIERLKVEFKDKRVLCFYNCNINYIEIFNFIEKHIEIEREIINFGG